MDREQSIEKRAQARRARRERAGIPTMHATIPRPRGLASTYVVVDDQGRWEKVETVEPEVEIRRT
jgi:hypothetical protein